MAVCKHNTHQLQRHRHWTISFRRAKKKVELLSKVFQQESFRGDRSLTSELDGKTCIIQTRPEPLGNSLFFPSPSWWSKSPAYSSSDFWDKLWWQYLEAGELQAPIFNSDSCLLCNNCPVKKISGYFQLDWQSQLQDWRQVCWSLALQSWSQQLSPHSHTLLLLRQP